LIFLDYSNISILFDALNSPHPEPVAQVAPSAMEESQPSQPWERKWHCTAERIAKNAVVGAQSPGSQQSHGSKVGHDNIMITKYDLKIKNTNQFTSVGFFRITGHSLANGKKAVFHVALTS